MDVKLMPNTILLKNDTKNLLHLHAMNNKIAYNSDNTYSKKHVIHYSPVELCNERVYLLLNQLFENYYRFSKSILKH